MKYMIRFSGKKRKKEKGFKMLFADIFPSMLSIYYPFQEYKRQFEKTLEKIAEEKQKLIIAEQRWMDSWNTSVDKVKQLY